jgi:hypothetical protein
MRSHSFALYKEILVFDQNSSDVFIMHLRKIFSHEFPENPHELSTKSSANLDSMAASDKRRASLPR